jgi:DNA-binding protein HU-beta
MNKGDLIKALAEKTGASKAEAQRAVETVVDLIVESLKGGEKVQLAGLGVINIGKRAARMGINPKTKEKIKISAKTTVKFKAAKELKEILNSK